MMQTSKPLRSSLWAVFALLLVCTVTSCSGFRMGAQPWERDLHAKPSMTFDQFDDDIDDHIYFSKEASSGGRAYGGGGCGCN